MAEKRRHYILTETAERDFRAARQWSLSRWGKELTKQYSTDFHRGAESTVQNQNHFASVEHIVGTSELCVYPIREHYLVYIPISNSCIVIIALIRQTRDVPAVLDANGFMIQRQLKEIFEKLERGEIPSLKK